MRRSPRRRASTAAASGAIVFDDPDELAWLESVLHPLVGERSAEWRAALHPDTRLAVVEVPLLFETGMERLFDATIAVVADDRIRAERAGCPGNRGPRGARRSAS